MLPATRGSSAVACARATRRVRVERGDGGWLPGVLPVTVQVGGR